jgi:hypothetical protein
MFLGFLVTVIVMAIVLVCGAAGALMALAVAQYLQVQVSGVMAGGTSESAMATR